MFVGGTACFRASKPANLPATTLPRPTGSSDGSISSPRIGADSFIKLYTHGAQERNSSALLGGGLKAAFDLLAAEAARRGCAIYFVSAWQMYLAIDAIRQRLDPVAAHSSCMNCRG